MKETLVVLLLIVLVTTGLFFISRNDIDITAFTSMAVLNQTAELSVIDLNLQSHFEEPCFVTISGTVKNTGRTDASEIVVSCFLQDEDKNPLGMEAEYLGELKKGYVNNFMMQINTMCLKYVPDYECRAECSNC